MSGNNVYGQSNNAQINNTVTFPLSKVALSDSTFLVQANVLMNVIADGYVATFGVSEEDESVTGCNVKIDLRIQNFIAELIKSGISKDNIYTDMATQTKVLDYKITGTVAQQFLKGFEIRKNVIVKFKNARDLEKMVVTASAYEIYDLVKVDYLVTDINKIYTQLFLTATEIINQKKGLYVAATNIKLSPSSQIFAEQFQTYYPAQLYKNYTPLETSEVYAQNYYNNYTRKDLRKNTTYYYDKLNYSGFDKVFNPAVTEPAVEFVLTLQIKFETVSYKK